MEKSKGKQDVIESKKTPVTDDMGAYQESKLQATNSQVISILRSPSWREIASKTFYSTGDVGKKESQDKIAVVSFPDFQKTPFPGWDAHKQQGMQDTSSPGNVLIGSPNPTPAQTIIDDLQKDKKMLEEELEVQKRENIEQYIQFQQLLGKKRTELESTRVHATRLQHELHNVSWELMMRKDEVKSLQNLVEFFRNTAKTLEKPALKLLDIHKWYQNYPGIALLEGISNSQEGSIIGSNWTSRTGPAVPTDAGDAGQTRDETIQQNEYRLFPEQSVPSGSSQWFPHQ